MALPIQYAVPELMKLSDLDSAMPDGTTSKQVRVTPSNLSSIVSPTYTTPARNTILADSAFNSQNVQFDIPCLAGSWIDTRQSTISFRAIYEGLTTGTTYRVAQAPNLRGGAFSFFDGLQVLGPAGNVLESISEMGIIYNVLTQFQMSNSDRDGNALQFGMYSGGADGVVKGHEIPFLGTSAADLAATNAITYSYSYPLLSSIVGTSASKMFPIGSIPKLQLILTTTNILPLTLITADQAIGANATFRITLTDIVLNLQYVTLPPSATQMIESSLHDGKYYLQGNTWRVAASTLSAGTSGFNSVISGVRGSSVKSVLYSFQELLAGRCPNGKYDSKNPIAQNICFNANSIRYPSLPVEALLHPARVMTELQRALGSFNSPNLKVAPLPDRFCRLSTGGTAQSLTANANTQDYLYTVQAAVTGAAPETAGQSSFFFGVDVEDVNSVGILSGINLNSSQAFLELNLASAVTNAHTVYCLSCLDSIVVIDARSGSCDVRV
jgi:hypothetical protein